MLRLTPNISDANISIGYLFIIILYRIRLICNIVSLGSSPLVSYCDFVLLPCSVQSVIHDVCHKCHGMCYPVCGMVHRKDPLQPMKWQNWVSSLANEWSFTKYLMPCNHKLNMLRASLNKTISFLLSLLLCTQCQYNCCYIQIYHFTLQEIQHFVDVYGDHQSLTEGSVEGIRHLCALLASESTALSSLVQQGRGMTST